MRDINAAYEDVRKLSNDDLRGKTVEFREVIHQAVADKENRIAEIKQELEEHYEMPVSEKEARYKEVEHLEKEVYDMTQEVLNDLDLSDLDTEIIIPPVVKTKAFMPHAGLMQIGTMSVR